MGDAVLEVPPTAVQSVASTQLTAAKPPFPRGTVICVGFPHTGAAVSEEAGAAANGPSTAKVRPNADREMIAALPVPNRRFARSVREHRSDGAERCLTCWPLAAMIPRSDCHRRNTRPRWLEAKVPKSASAASSIESGNNLPFACGDTTPDDLYRPRPCLPTARQLTKVNPSPPRARKRPGHLRHDQESCLLGRGQKGQNPNRLGARTWIRSVTWVSAISGPLWPTSCRAAAPYSQGTRT